MRVSAITNTIPVNNNYQVKEEEKNIQAKTAATVVNVKKQQLPTNPNMYQAMYGIKNNDEAEQEKYVKQMAEVRAKYETDVNDKNREIENNKAKESNQKKNEEKSYYEQYLEYKNKYQ